MLVRPGWMAQVGVIGCLALGAGAAWAAPGSETITQGEWANMLVARLGVSSALPKDAPPDEAASLLGARGIAVVRDGKTARTLTADGAQHTWRYELATPQTATWLLTVANAQPAFVSVGGKESKLIPSGGADRVSDAGFHPLARGAHAVTVTAKLPSAPDLAVVAGCHPVLPAGGWQSSAQLSFGNLGRTLVQALRQNGRLPAAEGLATTPVTATRVAFHVPAEGTYTVLIGGKALERATYRVDGCDETAPGSPTADGWREGESVLLTAGTHRIDLAGMDGRRSDGRMRLVRRATADAEYLAVLQSMGVKLTAGGKTTGSLDAGEKRTGLARRARGDDAAGLAALAGRAVTRADAERILATPVIARQLSQGVSFPRTGVTKPRTPEQDEEAAGTLEEPVTGTLQESQTADP